MGASCRNPVDTGSINKASTQRVLEMLDWGANIDNLAFRRWSGARTPLAEEVAVIASVIEVRKTTSKPIIAIIPVSPLVQVNQPLIEAIAALRSHGVPVFLALERGARALSNAWQYWRQKGLSA